MNEIMLSFYTLPSAVSDVHELRRLRAFCERINYRLAKMEGKLTLRKVIFDEINEDSLMAVGMITLKTDGGLEIAIEELLGLDLDFEKCDCNEFPIRIYKDDFGNVYKTIPDNLIMVAVLQTAFGVKLNNSCDCDCCKCTDECCPK